MAERKVLDLSALPADGWETQFDAMPLAPGVHLRWSFWPELGFPSGGFELKRWLWTRNQLMLPVREGVMTIATPAVLAPPTTVDGLIARTRTVSSGAATATLQSEGRSLLDLLSQARGDPRSKITAARGSQSFELLAMDALMLATVDPYVARAIGLGWTDGTVPAMMPADYQVFGYWGTTPYPWNETRFNALTPREVAAGAFMGNKTRWFSDRVLSLVLDGTVTTLQCVGPPALSLSVTFAVPAREIEIELSTPTPAAAIGGWTISGRSGTTLLRPSGTTPLTVTAAGSILRINSPDAFPLDGLELRDNSTSLTIWRIRSLRHRRKSGAVGTQWSRVLRVAPISGSSITEEHITITWPPPAVVTPAISTIRTNAAASALGDDGRVRADAAEVEIVTARPAPPPEDRPELTRAIRLHTGYTRLAGGGSPARSDVVTLPLPIAAQMLGHVGFWRLDGSLVGVGGGPSLIARGMVRYAAERPWSLRFDMRRNTLYLTGRVTTGDPAGSAPGYLEAAGIAALDAIGSELHVQCWVFPIEDTEAFPTLVGHDYRVSFWLGLIKVTTSYRVRCWLNGQVFESAGSIPQSSWSHVAMHYDGHQVHFYINGVLNVSRTAALGPVRPNPARRLTIGCDPEPANSWAYPFAGYMADVQVRRAVESTFVSVHSLAAWALDGDLTERQSGVVSGTIGTARYAVDHGEAIGRRAAQLDGTWCVVAPANRIADPGRRFCVKVRVKPDAGQVAPVIAAAKGWQLRLNAVGSVYSVTFTVGAQSVTSTLLIDAATWANIIAGGDGTRAAIYVNGQAAGSFTMRYGRVPGDAGGTVKIGAGMSAPLANAFRGLIADLEAGDILPAPASPIVVADRPSPLPLDPPPPAETPADFTLRDIDPGSYRVTLQGVDPFGRLGALITSSPFTIADSSTPPAPGGARARFLPVLGEVTSVTPPSGTTPRWSVRIALSRPTTLDASRLLRHDVELVRAVPDPREPGRKKIERAETYEIHASALAGSALILTLTPPPLPRLRPEIGERVTIQHDLWVRTEWTWTGTQRLLAPRVDRFRLAERRGLPPSTSWSTAWNALGPANVPVVATDIVAVDESAAAISASELTHTDWKTLRASGVVSIPEPFDPTAPVDRTRRSHARVWTIVLPATAPLPADPHRLPMETPAPEDFVAGALVAYNGATTVQAWQLFTVHWHFFQAGTGWTLYFAENSRGNASPAPAPPALVQARFYPGQRYRVDAHLTTPPAVGAAVPTLPIEIAVTALDTAGRTSPVDNFADKRTGGAADVIAVDRVRPPRPPQPTVSIGRADYHGTSRVTVTWTPAVAAHVYRATDSAVITRDVEQRRRGRGIYERPVEERLLDDEDFLTWLTARWPSWAPDWQTRLFALRPADERDTSAMAAWQAANDVWREWGARFYPALSDEALQEIAGRAGNEEAFVLVSKVPVTAGTFADSAPGSVRNRYVYRLRAQTSSLLPSTEYGPVSVPAAPPQSRPPARIVITRAEAGDRRITLYWTHAPERAVTHYRVYRAETAAEIEDPRFWSDLGLKRGLAEIVDPRLKARARAVVADIPDLDKVLAVYRADELTAPARTPFDYYAGTHDAIMGMPSRYSIQLRPIANDVPVVIAYRDTTAVERRLGHFPDGVVHVDQPVYGLSDYHYAVVAIDAAGNHSPPSAPLRARAYEEGAPAPAVWISSARAPGSTVASLSWSCDYPQRCLLLRRPEDASYHVLRSSLPPGTYDAALRAWVFTVDDTGLDVDRRYEFWVLGRTEGGHKTESARRVL